MKHLNVYAEIDSELLSFFLTSVLNEELRKQHQPKPASYAEWKELVMNIGGRLEAHYLNNQTKDNEKAFKGNYT